MANNFTTDPNCVALWRMEAGALTVDSIGTNTLTNSGVAESAGDFKEGACAADFDKATTDRLYITEANLSAGFPLKTGDVSLKFGYAFWTKIETFTATQSRFFSHGSASGDNGIVAHLSAAGVFSVYWGITPWAVETLVTGRWYHIGIFGDGVAKTITVRIWDETAGTATTYTHSYASAITTTALNFTIGSHETEGVYSFDGLIDELVVFKDELTVAEIDLIRTGNFGVLTLAGTVAAVAGVQGNITGVSTLLEGTIAAIASVTGELTGGATALGTATIDAVSGLTGTLSSVIGVVTAIPASTGGWAMGGAGVWASSTPTDTEIPADAEPTGFYFGGGAAEGEAEVVSTIPGATEIVPEGGFAFCGPGATGNAATTFPASEVIVPVGGFVFGGAGVWGQVAPEDLPSTVLVPTGGYVLGGTGFSLDPGVTPTSTVLVGTGGWKMGGRRPDPVEVAYPGTYDRVIEETAAYEMGGEGVWEESAPPTTVIVSNGAVFVLGGAGLATTKPPPIAVITGDGLGGFVLAGATPAEVFEAWCLSGQAFEPSVWSAFNFNSFAVKGGQAYAAGDAGIYLLGADHDAGETIQTGARIGPVNFGADRDKRIRGIQYGQGGKNTRVRVTSDDGSAGVFEPERDENRVVVSRDIQGREFTIDIMDFEELSHCEITPLRLARR